MLKTVDSILVVLLWAGLLVLSVLTIVRMVRGQPGNGYHSLPQSWRRWAFDEKDPIDNEKTSLSGR